MTNETWKFVQAKSKQAMKQVLSIKNKTARMKVTPLLAVAPLAHGDDMRWNPNRQASLWELRSSVSDSEVAEAKEAQDDSGQ